MPRHIHKSAIMGTDSIWRLLLRFSGPATIAMIVGSSYTIVDTIWVGRLGTDALAAITLTHPLVMILLSIVMGTGVGSASLIARRLGSGQYQEASKVASTTMTLLLIIGGLATAITLPYLTGLLNILGASGSVLSFGQDYLYIILMFAVVETFYMGMGHVVRAEGSPMYASVVHIIGMLTNLVLDPILIFGWGPFPEMGIAGAATATVIARSIGAILYIYFFVSGRSSAKFRLSNFIPRLKVLWEIYRVGLPSILRFGGFSVLMIFINRVAVGFGVTIVAVMGVIFRTNSFARMPSLGITEGALPLIGYNYGAKNLNRVGEVFVKAMKASFIWGLLCALLALIFPKQILSVFNSEPQFVEQGIPAMRLFAIVYLTMGARQIPSAFFQGIGKGLPALIIGLAREYLFILPLIYILPRLMEQMGLWITFPVSDILGAVLGLSWVLFESRRMGIRFRFFYPSKRSATEVNEVEPK
ncbi:MAG: MATE family efflux transporter [Chloroflexi bacterium]|jgi:putative MATE family efflux protein|nr:MATE family efflux transporter [Chloroflexota bacterium]MBT7080189.1 MATE family efflux transporter [Chloroflexota bacterium]MBT7290135.1 MATE family efflux transporter [Chloroflexota bacterium]